MFWPEEGQWFDGVVKEVDESDGTYKVHYFLDDEEHWHGKDMDVRSMQEVFDDMNTLLGTPPEGWSDSE